MKKGIHPENYRLVVFKDMSNDHMILTKSCANTKDEHLAPLLHWQAETR